jgi:hypothetical protein
VRFPRPRQRFQLGVEVALKKGRLPININNVLRTSLAQLDGGLLRLPDR